MFEFGGRAAVIDVGAAFVTGAGGGGCCCWCDAWFRDRVWEN